MSPKSLAKYLTEYFLENGNFASAGGALSIQALPASTRQLFDQEGLGFSGLSVQGVGYTVTDADEADFDPRDKPGVHIYVSRGSQKALAELPQEIAGVPCTTHNIGKLYVKPHQSAVTTHCGNLYEHGGRVACGSSCAPSGKSYSGTLGAIVRKSPNGPLFALSNNHVGQGSHGFIIPMDRVFSAFGGISLVGGHGV